MDSNKLWRKKPKVATKLRSFLANIDFCRRVLNSTPVLGDVCEGWDSDYITVFVIQYREDLRIRQ